MSDMTRAEAIEIIRKEYQCVDRDCDIERSCGKCDLMMPSKEPILEAYKIAINSLQIDEQYDLAMEQAGEFIPKSVLEDIRSEIEEHTDEKYGMIALGCGTALQIIDKHMRGTGNE